MVENAIAQGEDKQQSKEPDYDYDHDEDEDQDQLEEEQGEDETAEIKSLNNKPSFLINNRGVIIYVLNAFKDLKKRCAFRNSTGSNTG